MKNLLRPALMPACALVLLTCFASFAVADGKTRTYYIAVDEVDWDYTPMGMDKMMGKPFDKNSKMYFESDKHQIGQIYRKAVYREYTDGTFTTLKKRTPEWEHLGLLGPALHAEVGDTIQVFFKNKGPKLQHAPARRLLRKGFRRLLLQRRRQRSQPQRRHRSGWYSTTSGKCPSGQARARTIQVRSYGSTIPKTMNRATPTPDSSAPSLSPKKGWLDPMAAPKDVDREFVTAYFHHRRKQQLVSRPQHRSLYQRIRRTVNKLENSADGC